MQVSRKMRPQSHLEDGIGLVVAHSVHNGDGLEDEKLKLVHPYVNPSFSLYFFFFCLVCLWMDAVGCQVDRVPI